MALHRKEIAFDLDTKALEKFYRSPSSAYQAIRTVLEHHGFSHRQGSVYNSNFPMSDIQVATVIDTLCKKLPWLAECANAIDVTNIGSTHNLLPAVLKSCDAYDDLKKHWKLK
jgi:virulence-associated protein VapD